MSLLAPQSPPLSYLPSVSCPTEVMAKKHYFLPGVLIGLLCVSAPGPSSDLPTSKLPLKSKSPYPVNSTLVSWPPSLSRWHKWKLPVLRYHRIRFNYPYPFLGVIFWVILHAFITQNYHRKQSNCYPFSLIMVNYPIFFKWPHFMFSEKWTKYPLSPKNTKQFIKNW